MNNLVNITDENKATISVPFELKDEFKKEFPKAKWNADSKVWEVDIDKYNKLVEFAETINDAAEQINAQKELEFAQKQLEEIKKKVDKYADNITRGKDAVVKLKEVREELESSKKELEEKENELKEVEEQKENELNSVKDFVNGIIDIDTIESSVSDMKRVHNGVKRNQKDDFEDAKRIIKKEAEKLEDMGYESEGLEKILDANFNRPDRDNLNNIDIDNVYIINKV